MGLSQRCRRRTKTSPRKFGNKTGRFVEKVVQLRQTEFDDAWKKFPEAVAMFSGQKVEHALQQPANSSVKSTRSQITPITKTSNSI